MLRVFFQAYQLLLEFMFLWSLDEIAVSLLAISQGSLSAPRSCPHSLWHGPLHPGANNDILSPSRASHLCFPLLWCQRKHFAFKGIMWLGQVYWIVSQSIDVGPWLHLQNPFIAPPKLWVDLITWSRCVQTRARDVGGHHRILPTILQNGQEQGCQRKHIASFLPSFWVFSYMQLGWFWTSFPVL